MDLEDPKGSDAMWFKIIQDKYLCSGSFFSSPCAGTSQFWQSLHKVKHLFKWGAMYQVKDGRDIYLLLGRYLDRKCPCQDSLPELYQMCSHPKAKGDRLLGWHGTEWFPLEEVCLSLRCTVLIIYY